MTEAHVCEQLAQSRYLTVEWLGIEPATFQMQVRHQTIIPPSHKIPLWRQIHFSFAVIIINSVANIPQIQIVHAVLELLCRHTPVTIEARRNFVTLSEMHTMIVEDYQTM